MNIVMNHSISDQGRKDSITVTADDADAHRLARLLAMAGLAADHDGEQHVAPQGGEEEVITVEPAMENADHDHGHDEKSEVGEPLDVKDYVWDGPHINQRFGKIGDNTLMSETKERADSLFNVLSEQYTDYLVEADLAASNAGSQSPLTATKRDEFDKDPFSDEDPVTDGSRSPLSHIGRQDVMN